MCVLKPLIERLEMDTFLMTFIREPAERALSEFYHLRASRKNVTPDDDHILEQLAQEHNHMMDYIATGESVEETLVRYDFIGITDRFAESMLVLAHQLGLDVDDGHFGISRDILYVKSKDSHSDKTDNKGVRYIPSVPVRDQSAAVQSYLKGEWREQNSKDYELWVMANEELDRRIANIEGFTHRLEVYKSLLVNAQDLCGWWLPGEHDCITRDEGCRQQCVNKVFTKFENTTL